MTLYRQGDILLQRTRKRAIPADVPRTSRAVLALGEATGHAHVCEAVDDVTLPACALFDEPDGTRMLIVERPCVVRHDEHGQILLSPGAYRVVRQREYAPEGLRQVMD